MHTSCRYTKYGDKVSRLSNSKDHYKEGSREKQNAVLESKIS